MPRKTNVYILKLVAGKYYVGISKNPQKRIKDHFAGRGAGWTRKHAPLAVEAVHNGVDVFEEDMWTKRLMAEKGILNVRGGLYVRDEIPEPEQKMIQREIWSATAVCMRCGRDGHMAVHCNHIRDINGKIITCWEQCGACGNWADLPLR
jgi:predicted GIY-YIG superfamily endonuclease